MQVLVISTIYPNPNNPTSGIFVHEQVKQLINLGVDVRVICPITLTPPSRFFKHQSLLLKNWKRWFLSKQNIPKETVLDGINVYYPKWVFLPKQYFQHLEGDILFYSIHRLIRRIWKEWRWDILHAHFVTPNGLAAEKIAKNYEVPLVISCLGSDLNHYAKKAILHDNVKTVLNYAKAVICKSESLREIAIGFGILSERVHVIYNGCSMSAFRPLNMTTKQKEIIFIGNFIKIKCLDHLIEAFRNLNDKQVTLRLIGDGELLPIISETVYTYGLKHRVIFQGQVPHSQIPYFLNSAAILCLPSLSEGAPNVIMEAIACGIPVVASNVGGIPEIVPSFCGILVPPKDTVALKNALEEALAKDWNRKVIRKYAEERLSSETQCKKIVKIYQQILEK